MRLLDSSGFSLEQKNRAVWALGELKDKDALPGLESHLTGESCNQRIELCQYELKKTILKIKMEFNGSWQAKAEITSPDKDYKI